MTHAGKTHDQGDDDEAGVTTQGKTGERDRQESVVEETGADDAWRSVSISKSGG